MVYAQNMSGLWARLPNVAPNSGLPEVIKNAAAE
jgi:hypothetical protein